MSAAFERYAAAELEPAPEDDLIEVDLEISERNFTDLSQRLDDLGVNGIAVKAWDRERQRSPAPRLH
jgi:hypothetical protein